MKSKYNFNSSVQLDSDDELNPMATMGSMADLLLVFACGLMMSLIIYWQVDIGPKVTEVIEEQNLTQMDEIKEKLNEMDSDEGSYTKLGQVFKDPKTGKLYMLSEE